MFDLGKLNPDNRDAAARWQFDGKLDDGRFVEIKSAIPRDIALIARRAVAMANTSGGIFIFGVDERKKSVVGLRGDISQHMQVIDHGLKKLSLGIDYSMTVDCVDGSDRQVLILEIKKSASTAFFSREETSPARQTAYIYKEDTKGNFLPAAQAEMRYVKVYKYMTLDAFLMSLYSRKWRFFEPSKWNDKFEQRFYCARYSFPAAAGNTPQLFATCVTRERNSEAAWKVYANGQGLGAHCLQLELDVVELRKQLRASGLGFEERPIDYRRDAEILELHKKRSPYYPEYFRHFSRDSFLRLLSLKRDAYTYERELRLFLIPDTGGTRNKNRKAKSIDIDVDWSSLITSVRVDKKCSDAELVSIRQACFFAGIDPQISNYTFIGDLTPTPGLKPVSFERFDIDDMPGSTSIVIK